MKKLMNYGALFAVVAVVLLIVVGSAAAAPPQQYGGPGDMRPGPYPVGPWGGGGPVNPGTWVPSDPQEEAEAGTAVRIDFEVSGQCAHQGQYVIQYTDGAELATWFAPECATDSGWIGDLKLPRKAVWVEVVYYPGPHAAPTKLKILNPAPGTEYGWIGQGMSHAIEVAWPGVPVMGDMPSMPLRPDGMPWGPEGNVTGPWGMAGGPSPFGMGPSGMPGQPTGMPGQFPGMPMKPGG